jgi:hypothetical protein
LHVLNVSAELSNTNPGQLLMLSVLKEDVNASIHALRLRMPAFIQLL